ncbi:MAG: fibronectin type III domain-containing protein [Bifidobacteriaceae bacterium]|jgi:hypothetical protein|nr:fibronectin type III domain-containing protein [Bifidobacteriaceae bacterium]
MAVPIAIVAVALMENGFPEDRMDLHDASVWITTTAPGKAAIGRFNAPISELTGGVRTEVEALDVLQAGNEVLSINPTSLGQLDPVVVELLTPVGLPSQSQAAMGGGRVAVLAPARGELWVRRFAEIQDLRTGSDPPNAVLGPGAAMAIGSDGTVYAISSGGTVYAISSGGTVYAISSGGQIQTVAPTAPPGEAAVKGQILKEASGKVDQATVVGTTVYALAGSTVTWPGGSHDLSQYGSTFQLQHSGPAAKTVLIASSGQLLRAGSQGVEVVTAPGGLGAPARPVSVGGCVYAAWASPTNNYAKICEDAAPEVEALEDVHETSQLVFRVNRDVVVLNDTIDGRVWKPDESPKVIVPNWDSIDSSQDSDDPQEDQDPDFAEQLDCAGGTGSPTANDDSFGIRPGATAILPVLENDSTPSCGALSIESITQVAESVGRASVIAEGRAIQFTAAPKATGQITLEYSVSDGSAAGAPVSAEVTLSVRGNSVNGAPVALKPSNLLIEQGAEASIDVAQNFRDPDLDPLTLISAQAGEGLTVRADPAGRVTVMADGLPGSRTVEVTMSDGQNTATGTIQVSVRQPRTVTPQLMPVKVNTYVGQAATVKVADAVQSGTVEPVKLAAVPDVVGLDVEINLEPSTFSVTSSTPGTYLVPYTVVAGTKQGNAVARIDILPHTDAPPTPVAVLDLAYISAGRETTVAPLTNDVAPTASVKLLGAVQGAEGVDISGLKLATFHHQYLQIVPVREVTEPLTLEYNLVVDGQVVPGVIELLPATVGIGHPPTVQDMSVTVRTGGVVSVPVLENALDPEGGKLTVDPELSGCQDQSAGLAFVAGDVIRYQAPASAQSVQCVFTVRDPDGNATSGVLTIRARPSLGLEKEPPTPRELSGRVIEGEAVRVPVPLTGIDSDGDGVLLQGLASAPEKGRITAVGADFLEYEALPGEQGTDTFTYAVEDWVGLRSTAVIRIGIGPAEADEVNVLARDDQATVRPGLALAADVLANDLETNGSPLSLCGQPLLAGAELQATFGAGVIDLVTPKERGVYAVGYTACNSSGQESNATLSLTVDPNAPILAPIARDSVISPKETRNMSAVSVKVLEKVTNPSGPLSDLEVTLVDPNQEGASVSSDSSVHVSLGPEPRIVAFRVTNTSSGAQGVHSYAFVYVPKLGTFPPSLRPRANGMEVRAGVPQEIELASVVQVGPGKEPWLANPDLISATKSDGSVQHKGDNQTLVYTAERSYAGPASITFEVTDGETPDDPDGIRATLTLLLNVVGQDQQPPTLKAAVLRCAIGEEPAVLDLNDLTRVPGVPEPKGLSYERISASPAGFDVRLDGSVLSARALPGADVGSTATVSVAVTYLGVSGQGNINLQVVASRRPLLVLAQVPTLKSKGEPVSVDVLAGAANPVPNIGPPRLLSSAAGPTVAPDTAATVSVNGSVITLTPKAGFSGTARVAYGANDALGLPERAVQSSFDLVVIGRPEPPGRPRALGDLFDGKVELQWDTPRSNNADIDHYLVEWSGGRQECQVSPCTVTGLPMGVRYAFSVKAHNEAGYSDPSEVSMPILVDVPPGSAGTPTAAVSDRTAVISWASAASVGSPVTSYTIQISADSGVVVTSTVAASQTSYTLDNLANGRTYTARVQAHNTSDNPGPWSEGVSFVPVGPPGPPTVQLAHAGAPGQMTITWRAGAANGSSSVATSVTLEDTTSGSTDQIVRGSTDGSGESTVPAVPGHAYRVSVRSSADAQAGPEARSSMTMWDAPPAPSISRVPEDQRPNWGTDRGNLELKWEGGSPSWLNQSGYRINYTIVITPAGRPSVVVDQAQASSVGSRSFTISTPGPYQATVTACLSNMPAGATPDNSCASGSVDFTIESTAGSDPASYSGNGGGVTGGTIWAGWTGFAGWTGWTEWARGPWTQPRENVLALFHGRSAVDSRPSTGKTVLFQRTKHSSNLEGPHL